MARMRIKTGDSVIVISGKDRGKKGKVTQVFPKEGRLVVDGVNKMVKHLKAARRGQRGQRVDFHGPIHASNVMLADPSTGKPSRVRFELEGEGKDQKKVRIASKSGSKVA